MKTLLTSVLLIIGLLFFTGCSDYTTGSNDGDLSDQKFDSSAEMRAPAPGDDTIATIVSGNSNFTLLLAALQYAGLDATFARDDQYTVFAPTDEAFLNLVGTLSTFDDWDGTLDTFEAIDDLLGEDTVKDVLLYHVAEGRRAANSVVPKNERVKDRKIETLLPEASFYVAYPGIITDIAGQSATIDEPNISASNGIIHEINTVLLPLPPSE